MVRPCRKKNCGRKITKPKISVLIVIRTQLPTNNLCRIGGLNIEAAVSWGVGAVITGAGSEPAAAATSFSMPRMGGLASAVETRDSRRRGDVRKILRQYPEIDVPS